MKRIISILLLAVICVFAVSCGDNSDVKVPDGMKLISEDDDLFYLFVPSNWTSNRGYGNPYAYVSGEDTSNVTVMFYVLDTDAVTADPSAENPKEPYIDYYWGTVVESLENGFLSYSLSEDESNSTESLDSIYSKQFVYTVKTKDKTEYKCRSVVTYHGEMIFCLTYTAESANYDTHTESVNKIISEFKFKDGLLG